MKTKRIKLKDATPAQLNYLMATLEEDYDYYAEAYRDFELMKYVVSKDGTHNNIANLCYDSDWREVGSLIESGGISISQRVDGFKRVLWVARKEGITEISPGVFEYRGHPTTKTSSFPITAILLCHIASTLGEDVEVPENL